MHLIDDYTHLISKCQLGAGNRTCQYLHTNGKVYACAKHTYCTLNFSKQSDIASGDNCVGYHKYVPNQQYKQKQELETI